MLRLTGGEFRGRLIQAPPNDRTRPTQAKLRQALFNSLQAEIPEARVLDLFAGSGSLGLEALSRGAAHVTFVESERPVVKFLEKNIAVLQVEERSKVIVDAVEHLWARVRELAPFDVVLADPPYAGGWELKLLEGLPWADLLTEGGIFCLEWGVQKSKVQELPDQTENLSKIRERDYGDSRLTTFRRN